MGRATITSEQGEGRYTIRLDYGSAERTRRLARIEMRLFELGLRKTWQSELLADIEDGMPSLRSELDALILAYVAATKAVPRDPKNEEQLKKQIDAKTAQVAKQQAWIQEARNNLGMTELQIKSAELERGTLEQLNLEVEQPAWCADYTESKTGAVATLDINGEGGLILIAPGGAPPTGADGNLVAREMQSPEQVFWNAAVLPGWQKWKPMYRTGVITALDEKTDTCAVSLDYATSTARALEINQSATLSNVPIVYMDCNAGAFKVNDRVVVQFEGMNWSAPKVIGFVDNPRSCGVWLRYHYPDTSSSPFSEHAYKVPKGKDGPKVTPPEFHGQERFWRWDDGVSSLQRQEKNVQAAKSVAAQYVSMPLLYLQVRTLQTGWEFGLPGDTTRVGLKLSPIVDATYPGGQYYFAHEVLEETFPTRAQAEAWRPSPVEVHRWVPAVNRTFVMSYAYSSGLDRWVPPGDFASGSFVGQDTPPWP